MGDDESDDDDDESDDDDDDESDDETGVVGTVADVLRITGCNRTAVRRRFVTIMYVHARAKHGR
jgi:hypothetical protein